MKRTKKRMVTMLLIMAVLLNIMAVSVLATDPQTVIFGTSTASVNAERGGIVTLPITISAHNSSNPVSFSGMALTISYDKTKVSYVEASTLIDISAMSDAVVYHNTAASQINFAWAGSGSISVNSPSRICTLQFRVLDTASAGTTSLTAKVTELYDVSFSAGRPTWSYPGVANTNKTFKRDVVIDVKDSMVDGVIAAIGAIGTVSYTAESLEKIVNAASLYAMLTVAQKAAVTNYQKLLDAQVEYERLKAEASQSETNQEISGFIGAHARVLALTTDTVSLEDAQDVANAYAAFNALSASAKYQIFQYNAQLKALNAKLNVLKLEDQAKKQAEEEERQMRTEAQEYAAAFQDERKYFILLNEADLIADHYTGLNEAVAALNMLCDINPYVSELLAAERIILENLLAKVEAIIEEENQGQPVALVEANKFRRNFGWILTQTVDTITVFDKMDVLLALEVYKMQDDETQELLKSENLLLNSLLSQIEMLEEALPDEQEENDDQDGANGDSSTAGGTGNTGTVKSAGGRFLLGLANREIGIVVTVLFLLLALSLITLVTLQFFYHGYFKRKLLPGRLHQKREAVPE